MRKCVLVLTLVCLLLFSCIPVFAAVDEDYFIADDTVIEKIMPVEIGTVANTQEEIEEMHIQNCLSYMQPFFENPADYRVIGKNGEDITEQFYNENKGYYFSGDFKKVYEAVNENVLSLDAYEQYEEFPLNYALDSIDANKNYSALHYFCCLYTPAITYNEATVLLRGRYSVDIANGIIASASLPSVELDSFEHTDWQTMYTESISNTYNIDPSRETVEFSATFDLYGDGLAVVGRIYYGRYKISMTANASGSVIDYNPKTYVYPL